MKLADPFLISILCITFDLVLSWPSMAAKPFVAVDFCKKITGRCSKLAEKKTYLLINGQQCIPPSNKLLETNLDTLERVQHKLSDKPIHFPHVGPTIQEFIHILVRAHEIL